MIIRIVKIGNAYTFVLRGSGKINGFYDEVFAILVNNQIVNYNELNARIRYGNEA